MIALFMVSGHALAGQVSLAWDAVANATGYKLHYGQGSGSYSSTVDAGNQIAYTVPSLTDGARYYFAVSAYGPTGTTESGYSNEVSTVVAGTATAPTASFSASPTSGAAPLAVTLTDTSTGGVTSRSWTLGDGTTATTATVAKTYSAPGTYSVSLTVTGSGGSTTATQSINVSAAAPVASFSATPVTGVAPLAVNFSDSSSGAVTSWSWQFGDGGTSTTQNPSYSYTKAGTYAVTLNVTGPGGSNQATKTGYITVSSAPSGSGNTGATPATTAGLVAAYGFEEASGAQVIDASGNANHGTISGASRTSTTQFGNALKFNGTGNWVTVNDSASIDLTTGMTVEAWVYPTKSLSDWATVLMKEQSGFASYWLYANDDTNRPANVINVGGTFRQLSAGARLSANTWTHLASTYDGSTQKLYVNGQLAGSRPQTGTIAVSNGKLRIGGNSIWGEYFTGQIDEVRIYNRALTQAEIQSDSKRAVVGLVVSTKPDRTGSVPLNGLTVSGSIYISYKLTSPTATSNPVKEVKFWLDDPAPTKPAGAPRITEAASPFDFAGTLSDGTAGALNTTGLAKGVHTVTAQVTLNDGTVLPFVTGSFTMP
ncbi:MAG: LamG-like jellyroll fold domain-containing protein [Burkholderiales bacterium]